MQAQASPMAASHMSAEQAAEPTTSKSLLNRFKKRVPKVKPQDAGHAVSQGMGQAQARMGNLAQATGLATGQTIGQAPGQVMGQMRAQVAAHMPNPGNISVPQLGAAAETVSRAIPQMPSESLFNKSFIIGALLGLIIGATAVPTLINKLAGSPSAQVEAQAQTQAEFPADQMAETLVDNNNGDSAAVTQTEDSFLDSALSEDE